jgi:hypothetical protein
MRRLLLVAALTLLTTCAESIAGGKYSSLTIVLVNDDAQATNLIIQGEGFKKGNEVAPGGQRTVGANYEPGNPLGIESLAGRGGTVLHRQYCYARYTERTLSPRVVWDGTGMRCEHWQ